MCRRSLRLASGLFVAGVVACKAYSSTAPPAEDGLPDAGGEGAATGDAPPDDAGLETGGGPAEAGGDLLDETFESSCAGWVPYSGATIVWQAGVGRNGSGGCVFTAPSNGYVIKGVAAGETGTYEFDAWLRDLSDGGTSTSGRVAFGFSSVDGGVDGAQTEASLVLTSSFGLLQAVGGPPSAPAGGYVSFGAGPAGATYVIDDVRFFHQE
jgi:hypothetical protein